jgi:hypothetical protein
MLVRQGGNGKLRNFCKRRDKMPRRVSLDHFIGRSVVRIHRGKKENRWAIEFDGRITVHNKDKNRTTPSDDIQGTALLRTIFSETDTKLQFGTSNADGPVIVEEVILSPAKYTLTGLQGQDEEYYPQAAEEDDDMLPPDPSPERVAEGPDEEALEVAESAAKGTNPPRGSQ